VETLGKHLIVDARATYGLNDRQAVEDWVRHAVASVGLTLLGFQSWRLPSPHDSGPGVSITFEMVESHGAIETWPEHGVICMDFYSCVGFDHDAILNDFAGEFGVTEMLTVKVVKRFSPLPVQEEVAAL
jgi:S-adenosylmethionine/arginine decarboxylase-like enzyme